MNKYLMLNHGAGTKQQWDDYFTIVFDGDHFIGGSSLDEDSALSVKDGVFGPAISPTVSGYIVIQAESLEKAQELMRLCPVHQNGGTVEVFPLELSEE